PSATRQPGGARPSRASGSRGPRAAERCSLPWRLLPCVCDRGQVYYADSAMDAPQAGPGQVGDAAAEDGRVLLAAPEHPPAAGRLGQAHDPVGQEAAVVVVDVGLDEG